MSRVGIRSVVVMVALAFAMSAVAGSKAQSSKMTLSKPASVNGTELPAGEYKVKWEGEGAAVKVSFIRDGKVIATSDAKLVEQARTPERNSVLRELNGGTDRLKEVRFAGKKVALVITDSGYQAGN